MVSDETFKPTVVVGVAAAEVMLALTWHSISGSPAGIGDAPDSRRWWTVSTDDIDGILFTGVHGGDEPGTVVDVSLCSLWT